MKAGPDKSNKKHGVDKGQPQQKHPVDPAVYALVGENTKTYIKKAGKRRREAEQRRRKREAARKSKPEVAAAAKKSKPNDKNDQGKAAKASASHEGKGKDDRQSSSSGSESSDEESDEEKHKEGPSSKKGANDDARGAEAEEVTSVDTGSISPRECHWHRWEVPGPSHVEEQGSG